MMIFSTTFHALQFPRPVFEGEKSLKAMLKGNFSILCWRIRMGYLQMAADDILDCTRATWAWSNRSTQLVYVGDRDCKGPQPGECNWEKIVVGIGFHSLVPKCTPNWYIPTATGHPRIQLLLVAIEVAKLGMKFRLPFTHAHCVEFVWATT